MLRGEHTGWQNVTIRPGENLLGALRGDSLEIAAEFQVNPEVACFGLRVRVGDGEQTTIGYDVQTKKLFINRTSSGDSSFDEGFARVHTVDIASVDGTIRMRLFVDRSVVEVFGNDGQVVLADTIFPSENSQGLALFTQGGEVLLQSLEIYRMNSAKITTKE